MRCKHLKDMHGITSFQMPVCFAHTYIGLSKANIIGIVILSVLEDMVMKYHIISRLDF